MAAGGVDYLLLPSGSAVQVSDCYDSTKQFSSFYFGFYAAFL
jgi:hypothetical protein